MLKYILDFSRLYAKLQEDKDKPKSSLTIIVEDKGSRDSTYNWNRLLDQLKDRDEGKARSLFATLTYTVAELARSAGSINKDTLCTEITTSTALKDQLDPIRGACRSHRNRLNRQSRPDWETASTVSTTSTVSTI